MFTLVHGARSLLSFFFFFGSMSFDHVPYQPLCLVEFWAFAYYCHQTSSRFGGMGGNTTYIYTPHCVMDHGLHVA